MKLISCMNRIDWVGNPGSTIRRGEVFEIDDPVRIKTWIDAGYVRLIEEQVVGADIAPTPNNDVVGVKRWDGSKWDHIKDTTADVPKKSRKRSRKKKQGD